MLPVFLMASDRVKASFVNIHLVGECFDSLIIIRFAVENGTQKTRLMSHGKRMLFIADKSYEIWRRGARVERELINNADQTYEHHIIYPSVSWVKFADIPINTRKGLPAVGSLHPDNSVVAVFRKTTQVISVATLFCPSFVGVVRDAMSNKSVVIMCTATITANMVEVCTTRSHDFVTTRLTQMSSSETVSFMTGLVLPDTTLKTTEVLLTSDDNNSRNDTHSLNATLRWSATINLTTLNTHPYHRSVLFENFRL